MRATEHDGAILTGMDLRPVASGLDHPEGVCWSPGEQLVYAGGEAGQLYRFSLDAGAPEHLLTVEGGILLGLALDAEGTVYACDPGNGRVQAIGCDGSIAPHGARLGYPNYAAFESSGALWVSDSGSWGEANGWIWRIDEDGTTERHDAGPFRFANGLAFDAAEDYLYVAESGMPGVSRVRRSGGGAEPVVEIPRTVPDGLAFDVEGGLWISCFQPNRIYRLDPGGRLETVVDDWSGEVVLSPTNVAFAGESRSSLVLASLCGREVKAIDAGVAGQPLPRPQLGRRG